MTFGTSEKNLFNRHFNLLKLFSGIYFKFKFKLKYCSEFYYWK